MNNLKIKIALFLNYFVFAILLNSVGTVILQVQNNFGIAKDKAAYLEGFKDLSIAITSFIIAAYILKIGYKRAMVIAMTIITAICFLMPSLGSFWATKVLFALVGIGFALIKISTFSTIGLVTKNEKEHLSLMNFLESFFMVGVLIGGLIFSFFVDNDNPSSTVWFNVYYLIGSLSFLALLLLLTANFKEKESEIVIEKTNVADDFFAMLKLVTIPLVLIFICSAFFYVLVEQSIMSWLPTFNKDVLKLSTSLSIQMAGILSLSIAIGRFLAGIILRKLDWSYVLVSCLLIAAAFVLLVIPLSKNVQVTTINSFKDVPLVAFIFPLIGLLLAPIYPAINSVVLSNLDKKHHGAMSGLIVVFSALGGTTGSIITGNVFQKFGGQTAFYFSLIPISLLIILLIAFKYVCNKKNKAASVIN